MFGKYVEKKDCSFRTTLDIDKWNSKSFLANPAMQVTLGFGRDGLYLVFMSGALLPLYFGFSSTSFVATCGALLMLGPTSSFVTFSPFFAFYLGFVMPPRFFSRVWELVFSRHHDGSVFQRRCSANAFRLSGAICAAQAERSPMYSQTSFLAIPPHPRRCCYRFVITCALPPTLLPTLLSMAHVRVEIQAKCSP